MRTYTATPKTIEKAWILIDADGLVVGRLASFVATRLRGKHRPDFTPNMDCGDNVIVVNADKIVFSGNKTDDKTYYRHTGYPGGIKSQKARQILEGKHPERIIEKAVQRMLPSGPLGRKQFSNLHVYSGGEHPHEAQKPDLVDVAALNKKNTRG